MQGILSFGLLSSLFSLVSAVTTASAVAALTGNEIMLKNEDARKIIQSYSKAELKTGGGGATERVKKFEWWKKISDDGVHYRTLTRFHFPAEIKGEGILFLEHPQDQNEILMYLPNFKKIRRVESQQQSQSFMGSDFSYSDMATPHTSEYQNKLLREEACDASKPSVSCFVVESTPVSDAIRERTGYSKSLVWVRSDNFMVVKAEYWSLEGELFKKMNASDITLIDPVRKKWMAFQIKIESLKSGHSTQLQFSEVKVNQEIPESVFTQNNLSKN